jgi:hypothetical protein
MNNKKKQVKMGRPNAATGCVARDPHVALSGVYDLPSSPEAGGALRRLVILGEWWSGERGEIRPTLALEYVFIFVSLFFL